MRALWGPRWWWLPALPWVVYAIVIGFLDPNRWAPALLAVAVGTAAYGGERARRVYMGALPMLVLLLLYDAMRYVLPLGLSTSRVLGCGLRDAELALFGVSGSGHLTTPNEWFAAHSSPVLDLLCAGPYGAYIGVMMVHYAYLAVRRPEEARFFSRVAVGTHVLGFLTYVLLPAAPPWYVSEHGCGIDLAVKNSPAALARVDALLGVDYFHALYSNGSTTFGALPSLHVTYPLYGLLATFRSAGIASRAVQIAYALVMPFAAVYLGHHYVIDVLLGLSYVVVTFVAVAGRWGLPRGETDGARSMPAYAPSPFERTLGMSRQAWRRIERAVGMSR
jgi:inositol phosphorylceramide synthase catalytic subunit